jgi:hypothetical protein
MPFPGRAPLVAYPDLRRVRQDALLEVSRVIVERRLGLTAVITSVRALNDKLLYLKKHIED